MSWEKASVIRFFQTHEEQFVLVEEQETRVKFRGTIADVYELDLCSSILFEATLVLKTPGLSLSLTFHDEFVGVHLMTTHPDPNDPEISIPYQIRYDQLHLTV